MCRRKIYSWPEITTVLWTCNLQRVFKVGVLKLTTINSHPRNLKLQPRFNGLFEVITKNLPLAYQLHFPDSLLEKILGQNTSTAHTLPLIEPEGLFLIEPITVSGNAMIKRNVSLVGHILRQWSNSSGEDAIVEDGNTI